MNFFFLLFGKRCRNKRDPHTRADFLEDAICACKLFIWKRDSQKSYFPFIFTLIPNVSNYSGTAETHVQLVFTVLNYSNHFCFFLAFLLCIFQHFFQFGFLEKKGKYTTLVTIRQAKQLLCD